MKARKIKNYQTEKKMWLCKCRKRVRMCVCELYIDGVWFDWAMVHRVRTVYRYECLFLLSECIYLTRRNFNIHTLHFSKFIREEGSIREESKKNKTKMKYITYKQNLRRMHCSLLDFFYGPEFLLIERFQVMEYDEQ